MLFSGGWRDGGTAYPPTMEGDKCVEKTIRKRRMRRPAGPAPGAFLLSAMRRSGYRAVSSRRASFFRPRRMLSHTRRRSAPSIRAISATLIPR